MPARGSGTSPVVSAAPLLRRSGGEAGRRRRGCLVGGTGTGMPPPRPLLLAALALAALAPAADGGAAPRDPGAEAPPATVVGGPGTDRR